VPACRLLLLLGCPARTLGSGLSVGQLAVTPTPASGLTYKVQGNPALKFFFRDGKELARHEGALAKPSLRPFLDAHL